MNLYLISQNENIGYDTFDSAVVAAENEKSAQETHPIGMPAWHDIYSGWATKPENVNAELIGTAIEGTKPGVICASFNAG